MPYHVGKKGSYGCDGYPALKNGTNEVMGCHKTAKEAAAQIYAINRSEGKIGKAMTKFSEGDFVIASCEDEVHVGRVEYVMTNGASGIPGSEYYIETSPDNPALIIRTLEFESDGQYWEETEYLIAVKAEEAVKIEPLPLDAEALMVNGQLVPEPDTMPGMDKAYENCGCATCKKLNVSCDQCPDCKNEMAQKGECCPEDISKQAPCWEGYVQRGMKVKNGKKVPNCVPAAKAEDLWEDEDDVTYEDDMISKADTYSPPAGARAAARRAIKFKEDGKANGAGTAVGWTRAGQLARGESLSLSTVKRMYSYFSRHEVDKKGKDWGNNANPSNGYIMWLAWGGDAGFAWSRRIVAKETDKMLFANFGREVGPAETVRDTYKRDFSTEQRQRMAEAGTAMPDGSYPIGNKQDLMNAIRSWGRGGSDPKVKEHIKRRARALGLEDMIPENWNKSYSIFDPSNIKPRNY